MKELKNKINEFAERCGLKDDIDDRCVSAAFSGVLYGLELSREYTKEEIKEFLEKYK